MSRDPPKWHVICWHTDMSWKCRECCPNMLSDSVVRTMPEDMICHVRMMSADILADSFDIKKECGRLRLKTVLPIHRRLLCQPNHDKPSAASGSAAFALVVSFLVASRLMASGLTSFGFAYYCWLLWVQCWLVQWCGASKLPVASNFVVVSFWVSCSGFREATFWGAGFSSISLAAAEFRWCQVHHLDAWTHLSQRLQNPTLPNPMRRKPQVCPCHFLQMQQKPILIVI